MPISSDIPLVFLHGFMQDATSWDALRAALPPTVHSIAIDLSPACAHDATLEALAAKVHDAIVHDVAVRDAAVHDLAVEVRAHEGVLRHAQPEMPGCAESAVPRYAQECRVVLVGYSLGGRVALEYARRWPETLAALVLESASFGPASEADRAQLRERNTSWAHHISEAVTMEDAVSFWESLPLFASQHALPEAVRAQQRRMRLSCNKDHLVWLLEHAGTHTMPRQEEAFAVLNHLAEQDRAVHYVAGTQDSAYAQRAAHLATQVPRAHVHMQACGHNTHLEEPREFITLITSILADSRKG